MNSFIDKNAVKVAFIFIIVVSLAPLNEYLIGS